MLESVVGSLIATGLATAGSRGKEYYEEQLHNDFSEDLSEIGEEFNRSLRDNITQTINKRNIDQLSNIGDQWTVVERRLNAETHLDFPDKDAAIDEITDAILYAAGPEASVRFWVRRNVKQAVAETYGEAVEDFRRRIAGTDRADLLGFANDQELLNRCDTIEAEIDEVLQLLQRRQYYDPFDATPEGFERARRRLTSEDIEFVDREDLPDDIEGKRLFLYGRKGVGKSRTLAELTRRINPDELSHIIVPREGFDSREDIGAIEQESFSGNVLLLWDDIHKVAEEGDDVTVLSLIKKLEDILEDRGYVLRAFVTSRSERLDQLPGSLDDPDSFWYEFEQIKLPPLDPKVLFEIFRRALEHYEVEASDDVMRQFVAKALQTDPSPFYVVSVVGLADDELTAEDIEILPETALEVWEYQYGQLGEESQRVLRTIELLSLADAPFYKSLVEDVYRHVFNRPAPEYGFRKPTEPLLNQQWITLTDSDADPFDDETEYRVHDIQLEAIEHPIDSALEPFSDYLRTELQSNFPEVESEQRAFIHRRFATTARELDVPNSSQIATRHYQYILESINSEDIETRIYFGHHLREQEKTKEAIEQGEFLTESLTEDIKNGRDDAEVYYFRGGARGETGDHEGAAKDFSAAIERGLDDAATYSGRGLARLKTGDNEGAAKDFSAAIERGRDDAEVYFSRGTARAESGSFEGAVEDFEQALAIDPEDGSALRASAEAKIAHGNVRSALEDAQEANRLADSDDDHAVSLLLLLIAKTLLELSVTDEERDYRTVCGKEFNAGWDLGILDSWLQRVDLTDEKRDRITELLDLYREH